MRFAFTLENTLNHKCKVVKNEILQNIASTRSPFLLSVSLPVCLSASISLSAAVEFDTPFCSVVDSLNHIDLVRRQQSLCPDPPGNTYIR